MMCLGTVAATVRAAEIDAAAESGLSAGENGAQLLNVRNMGSQEIAGSVGGATVNSPGGIAYVGTLCAQPQNSVIAMQTSAVLSIADPWRLAHLTGHTIGFDHVDSAGSMGSTPMSGPWVMGLGLPAGGASYSYETLQWSPSAQERFYLRTPMLNCLGD